MGLVIGGKIENPDGLQTLSWHDNPKLRLKIGEDGRKRKTKDVKSIITHTTRGIPGGSDLRPQKILPGLGKSTDVGERVVRYWSGDKRQAGAHLTVDHDGLICCLADLRDEVSFHAGAANEYSIGIEIFQGSDAEMYEGQLDVVVKLVDFLTLTFGIQRQYQRIYRKKAIPRLTKSSELKNVIGVYGHRDCSNNRGLGDPGDRIFEKFRDAGYIGVDYSVYEDVAMWKLHQLRLNEKGENLAVDGIPGKSTLEALERNGYHRGIIVSRPGD